jgi:hypothetical protein
VLEGIRPSRGSGTRPPGVELFGRLPHRVRDGAVTKEKNNRASGSSSFSTRAATIPIRTRGITTITPRDIPQLEFGRKAEADREANRRRRRLNFPISQNELRLHFNRKKIKTQDAERSTEPFRRLNFWDEDREASPVDDLATYASPSILSPLDRRSAYFVSIRTPPNHSTRIIGSLFGPMRPPGHRHSGDPPVGGMGGMGGMPPGLQGLFTAILNPDNTR